MTNEDRYFEMQECEFKDPKWLDPLLVLIVLIVFGACFFWSFK